MAAKLGVALPMLDPPPRELPTAALPTAALPIALLGAELGAEPIGAPGPNEVADVPGEE